MLSHRYMMNGLVKAVPGSTVPGFWRIDDLEAGREGIDFLRKPAVLVLAEGNDSFALANRICDWLNGDDWLTRERQAFDNLQKEHSGPDKEA